MLTITRTQATNPDFLRLVSALNADLAQRDGADHAFYAQFNSSASLTQVVVAYIDGQAAACGAIKPLSTDCMEVKRMYTAPEHRSKGLASAVLTELEQWARELSYASCRLETGKRQPEAIQLYQKNGYRQIPNYGQYAGVENSVCFEKEL
ncbi:MAG: GNAT family N-acetyltransferase [Candidatus Pseudobacter hemicellulosilyticus]|uniref:GNAT family N-acetyltransferase n=1 Tax=Candidatus Pseudobacter hemicellulosilyticus TaxID=3121375 RepID=A0AAJ5X0X3_9BACT|nr:MAG: GNAT family N-acetyltransferase [Pseudobacter sp.]